MANRHDELVTTARFLAEIEAGLRTGNSALVTSAGLRREVASFDSGKVARYLLSEMGISAIVAESGDGLMIAVPEHHGFARILRALRGSFRVIAAMAEDGQQAMKVLR